MPGGRPPKPTKLKELAGNPGKRALNKAEPKPAGKRPACPRHIQGEAKKEWNRITKQLLTLGLLTEVDRAALAAYCQCWARWVEAEEEMRRLDFRMITQTDSGYPVVSPWMGIANTAMKQMLRYLTEFGMTPAARSRVTVATEQDADPYEEFLRRKDA
ncbi:MAG TPA: phage terminase small subunit P27 family [Candidatus Competibacter phosphatis]|nr:phage terminase small subunit P27 family [Candidatus Competibacter phosphatis]